MRARADNRRKRRTAWTALALFVAVWAHMALQPCLMAAEPLLPASHHAGDCPHCPPADHCGDAGRCAFIDGYDFDARQPALPDPQPVLLVAAVQYEPVAAPPAGCPAEPPDARGLDPGPGRYLLHCRFLN